MLAVYENLEAAGHWRHGARAHNVKQDHAATARAGWLPLVGEGVVGNSVPPFGIDIFEGVLQGLQLAEAEFDSPAEADALMVPDFILHEVTEDGRFTGGQLVRASRPNVEEWLAEYGMTLSHPHQLD